MRALPPFPKPRGRMNPSTLSERLRVSRSRITATLSALRKKGFVTLKGSEDDRRRVWVTLTPEGAEFLRRKQQKVEEYFDRLVEGLGKPMSWTS